MDKIGFIILSEEKKRASIEHGKAVINFSFLFFFSFRKRILDSWLTAQSRLTKGFICPLRTVFVVILRRYEEWSNNKISYMLRSADAASQLLTC